jgi:hypothetical protein
MERLNLEKLNEGEVKEQYMVTITNKLSASETWMTMRTLTGHGTILEGT